MYSKRSEYTGECQSCRCIKCDLTKFTTESGTVTALTLYPSTDLFSMTGTWAVCGGSLQRLPAMGVVLLFMGPLQAPNLHKAMQLLTCFCHTTNLIVFQLQCSYGDGDILEYAIDGRMFEMDLRAMDGDVDLPEYALTSTDSCPQGEHLYIQHCTQFLLITPSHIKAQKEKIYRITTCTNQRYTIGTCVYCEGW